MLPRVPADRAGRLARVRPARVGDPCAAGV